MKKTVIAVGIIIAILIVGIVSVFLLGNRDGQTENNEYNQEITSGQSEGNIEQETAEQESKEPEDKDNEILTEEETTAENKVYVPTFMYFVTNTDEKDTKEAVNKLKKEYQDNVTFDIVNVDENPDAKNNFPVEGNTPMLIMLNTNNDISAFEPKCSDYNVLKKHIENAFITE